MTAKVETAPRSTAPASPAAVRPSSYGEAFASVFDAHLAPDDTDAVLGHLRDVVGPPPARLLELGVGTGRLALPLVAAGYDVAAVEASPSMASVLRGKPDGERVRLIMGDFGDAELGGPYDLVYGVEWPLSELYPFERLQSCLRSVAAALAPDGHFVVDAAVPPEHRLEQRRVRDESPLARGGRLLTDFRHDPDGSVAWGTATVVASDGTPIETEVVCSYLWPSELDELAADAGLMLDGRTGSWAGAPHAEDDLEFVSTYRRAPR